MKLKTLILPLAAIITSVAISLPASAVIEIPPATVTPSVTEAKVNDTFSVDVSFTAAAWNIHLAAAGPVSGCTIDEVGTTSDAQNAPQTFTTNCTSTGTGTVTLTLSGDISILDRGIIYVGPQSGSTTIVVTADTTSDDPVTGDDPTPGDDGSTTGNNSGTTTGDGNVSLPKTYDSVGRSFAAVGILSAIMAGVYLYNRGRRA